jgi:hypothetical protein
MSQFISNKNWRKLVRVCFSNDIQYAYVFVEEGRRKMKNKKGEIGIGTFIMAFVGIIVGVTLFLTIAQTVGESTTSLAYTSAARNYTFTIPANGSSVDLSGQDLLSVPVIYSPTGNVSLTNSWYTVGERVSPTTGVKTIYFRSNTVPNVFIAAGANATYVYGPAGYINDSAGRSVAGLITIMFALVIAVIALTPSLRSGVLQMMGR